MPDDRVNQLDALFLGLLVYEGDYFLGRQLRPARPDIEAESTDVGDDITLVSQNQAAVFFTLILTSSDISEVGSSGPEVTADIVTQPVGEAIDQKVTSADSVDPAFGAGSVAGFTFDSATDFNQAPTTIIDR